MKVIEDGPYNQRRKVVECVNGNPSCPRCLDDLTNVRPRTVVEGGYRLEMEQGDCMGCKVTCEIITSVVKYVRVLPKAARGTLPKTKRYLSLVKK